VRVDSGIQKVEGNGFIGDCISRGNSIFVECSCPPFWKNQRASNEKVALRNSATGGLEVGWLHVDHGTQKLLWTNGELSRW
jgi:hypothetical protein